MNSFEESDDEDDELIQEKNERFTSWKNLQGREDAWMLQEKQSLWGTLSEKKDTWKCYSDD